MFRFLQPLLCPLYKDLKVVVSAVSCLVLGRQVQFKVMNFRGASSRCAVTFTMNANARGRSGSHELIYVDPCFTK